MGIQNTLPLRDKSIVKSANKKITDVRFSPLYHLLNYVSFEVYSSLSENIRELVRIKLWNITISLKDNDKHRL